MPHLFTIRVPHVRPRSGLTWGYALRAAAMLSTSLCMHSALAQNTPCGLTSIQQTGTLIYPPIARAAHVQGPVVLLVTFLQDGTVSVVKTVAGHRMLESAATQYVKTWRANPFTGPRECPISITFRMVGQSAECGSPEDKPPALPPQPEHIDLQHVLFRAPSTCTFTEYATAGGV